MLGMRVLVGFLSHQRIRLSSSQYAVHATKQGPALDQVKAWQQAVDPAIDELRQIGSLLPQLTAQIRDSAGQINEFSQQQQRFEVALQDLHSELQRLKSYRCCAADH
jgi:TolA-binding protein